VAAVYNAASAVALPVEISNRRERARVTTTISVTTRLVPGREPRRVPSLAGRRQRR
jgi:hypothetical protein